MARTRSLRTQWARHRVDHGTICGRSYANSGHHKPLCACVDNTFINPNSSGRRPENLEFAPRPGHHFSRLTCDWLMRMRCRKGEDDTQGRQQARGNCLERARSLAHGKDRCTGGTAPGKEVESNGNVFPINFSAPVGRGNCYGHRGPGLLRSPSVSMASVVSGAAARIRFANPPDALQ
jgi:hypothetical protein